MKIQTYIKTYFICIILCAMLVGCGNTENKNTYLSESLVSNLAEQQAEPYLQLPDSYQQIILYIQEGFRKYNVEGEYQVYFGSVDENDYGNFCDILLEGTDDSWMERILYTFDTETGWYTFDGQYEPIFSKVDFRAEYDNSSFVSDMKENYLYKMQLSQNTDIAIPIHYYSESGPVEQEEIWLTNPYNYSNIEENLSYSISPRLYTYLDDRMDIDITIQYPVIYFIDNEMEDAVNEKIKKAFFYGYSSSLDDGEVLHPEEEMYSTITRQYSISRADENYLSIRIYEYNDSRLANHPNEWETGITIDMQTGKLLTLQDVIGEEWTPESLLDSGIFKANWEWSPSDPEEDWINEIKEKEKNKTLSDYDSYFYLTDENLGLVTFMSRYYTNIEANLKDLNKIHPLPFFQ